MKTRQVKLVSEKKEVKREEISHRSINLVCVHCKKGSKDGKRFFYGYPYTRLTDLFCRTCYKNLELIQNYIKMIISPKMKPNSRKSLKKNKKNLERILYSK